MAKPNYQFQKRQKEMLKKKKMEEKRQRKLEKSAGHSGDNASPLPGQDVVASKDE